MDRIAGSLNNRAAADVCDITTNGWGDKTDMTIIQFSIPPMPHYVVGGQDTYLPGRSHPNRVNIAVFDLIFVTKGKLYLSEELSHWTVGAGEALILRPDRHHYPTHPCDEETHFYWVHLQTKGDWIEENAEIIRRGGHAPLVKGLLRGVPLGSEESQDPFPDGPYIDSRSFFLQLPRFFSLDCPSLIYHRLRDLIELETQPQPMARWKEQRIFQELLNDLILESSALHGVGAVQTVAESCAKYLRGNYHLPLSYATLGEIMNFHPKYISRCMRQVYGCSPHDYLTSYRLGQAKLLLMNTDYPIEQIAEQTGFRRVGYFSRCFSKAEGMSPRHYRNQYRSKNTPTDMVPIV